MHKKSQAAMEFLMTYGWALLVVIIVIAALAFFGLLNPGRFLPEKCEIGPGISCLEATASTNNATMSDGNNTNDLITNDTIYMNYNNMEQHIEYLWNHGIVPYLENYEKRQIF